jgi:hypothetical protein
MKISCNKKRKGEWRNFVGIKEIKEFEKKENKDLFYDKKKIEQEKEKIWREEVLKLFPVCIVPDCNKKSNDAHHIVVRTKIKNKFIVENGIGFCHEHHLEYHQNYKVKNKIDLLIGYDKIEKLKKISDGLLSVENAGFTKINLKEIKK